MEQPVRQLPRCTRVAREGNLALHRAVKMRQAASRVVATSAPAAVVLVRFLVGGVFLSEGIQKFLFPDALGVGRFIKIGIPAPALMAPFVGVVEIVCGVLIIVGLLTRIAAVPLIIDMLVAIGTTKIPMLMKSGFWAMAHEARVDYAMMLGSGFLLLVGAGRVSLDGRIGRPKERDS
jgi:putative oxidoreductase